MKSCLLQDHQPLTNKCDKELAKLGGRKRKARCEHERPVLMAGRSGEVQSSTCLCLESLDCQFFWCQKNCTKHTQMLHVEHYPLLLKSVIKTLFNLRRQIFFMHLWEFWIKLRPLQTVTFAVIEQTERGEYVYPHRPHHPYLMFQQSLWVAFEKLKFPLKTHKRRKDDVFLPKGRKDCVLCHFFIISLDGREVKLGCETLLWNKDICLIRLPLKKSGCCSFIAMGTPSYYI